MISIDPLGAFFSVITLAVTIYFGITRLRKPSKESIALAYEFEPEVFLDDDEKSKIVISLLKLKNTSDFWPSLNGTASGRRFRANMLVNTWERVKHEIDMLVSYKLLSYQNPQFLTSKGGASIVQIEFTIESRTLRVLLLEVQKFNS